MAKPDYEKIIQIINFFARRSNNKITKLYLLKLVFLADRYHMRMYGRMITNDSYLAMQYGPVASETKKVFEFTAIPDYLKQYAADYLSPSSTNDNRIKSKLDIDLDVFSETDIEALKVAWDVYKEYGKKIIDYTHEFPEWKKQEEDVNNFNLSPMNLEDFFLDAPKNIEYCPANKERVQLNHTHFMEMALLN